jgi:hypothetical protein
MTPPDSKRLPWIVRKTLEAMPMNEPISASEIAEKVGTSTSKVALNLASNARDYVDRIENDEKHALWMRIR